ncbi:hypothetical protein Tco_1406205 [Tanacetum coccineum]
MDVRFRSYVIPPTIALPPGSPSISPPPLLESSSDSDTAAPGTANGASWVRRLREDTKTLYGSVRTLERGMKTRQTENATTRTRVNRIWRRMYAFDIDLDFIKQDATRTIDDVFTLRMGVWASGFMSEVIGRGVVKARPSESIDVLAVYGDAKYSDSQGPPDGPQTMPPRRLKRRDVKRLVANRVAEAIAEYKRNKPNPEGAGGSGGNAGGDIGSKVRGCSYKTFLNCKPHSFNGTEGVVGLSRWFKKMESVFEISKCAEEDKVKYAVCTLEGRALTWWNGNVHSLGINAANQIP